MQNLPIYMEAEQWLRHLFSSQAAKDGGVVRRKIRDVDRFVGRAVFLHEMQRRGFSVVENAGQFVVFCNHEPIKQVV